MIEAGAEQRSLDWFRARMGCFSGSRVSELMKQGRKSGETWSETAKTYIYQVAGDRLFNPDILHNDDLFQDYLNTTSFTTKAIQWGIEMEEQAKATYIQLHEGAELAEVGSCRHDTIDHFAASPDGIVYDRSCGVMRCLEVKCPSLATHMKYTAEIHDGESLKRVKPEYYWQVMAEMACTGTQTADFLSYCPWIVKPMHTVRIERNDEDIRLMEERVRLANEEVEAIMGVKNEE